MASKYVVTPEAVRQIGKLFKRPESVEGLDKFLGVGQDGDEVGLGAGTGSLAGFELAVEEEGGIGEFFPTAPTVIEKHSQRMPQDEGSHPDHLSGMIEYNTHEIRISE